MIWCMSYILSWWPKDPLPLLHGFLDIIVNVYIAFISCDTRRKCVYDSVRACMGREGLSIQPYFSRTLSARLENHVNQSLTNCNIPLLYLPVIGRVHFEIAAEQFVQGTSWYWLHVAAHVVTLHKWFSESEELKANFVSYRSLSLLGWSKHVVKDFINLNI